MNSFPRPLPPTGIEDYTHEGVRNICKLISKEYRRIEGINPLSPKHTDPSEIRSLSASRVFGRRLTEENTFKWFTHCFDYIEDGYDHAYRCNDFISEDERKDLDIKFKVNK
jgi:hypothetical protein